MENVPDKKIIIMYMITIDYLYGSNLDKKKFTSVVFLNKIIHLLPWFQLLYSVFVRTSNYSLRNLVLKVR